MQLFQLFRPASSPETSEIPGAGRRPLENANGPPLPRVMSSPPAYATLPPPTPVPAPHQAPYPVHVAQPWPAAASSSPPHALYQRQGSAGQLAPPPRVGSFPGGQQLGRVQFTPVMHPRRGSAHRFPVNSSSALHTAENVSPPGLALVGAPLLPRTSPTPRPPTSPVLRAPHRGTEDGAGSPMREPLRPPSRSYADRGPGGSPPSLTPRRDAEGAAGSPTPGQRKGSADASHIPKPKPNPHYNPKATLVFQRPASSSPPLRSPSDQATESPGAPSTLLFPYRSLSDSGGQGGVTPATSSPPFSPGGAARRPFATPCTVAPFPSSAPPPAAPAPGVPSPRTRETGQRRSSTSPVSPRPVAGRLLSLRSPQADALDSQVSAEETLLAMLPTLSTADARTICALAQHNVAHLEPIIDSLIVHHRLSNASTSRTSPASAPPPPPSNHLEPGDAASEETHGPGDPESDAEDDVEATAIHTLTEDQRDVLKREALACLVRRRPAVCDDGLGYYFPPCFRVALTAQQKKDSYLLCKSLAREPPSLPSLPQLADRDPWPGVALDYCFPPRPASPTLPPPALEPKALEEEARPPTASPRPTAPVPTAEVPATAPPGPSPRPTPTADDATPSPPSTRRTVQVKRVAVRRPSNGDESHQGSASEGHLDGKADRPFVKLALIPRPPGPGHGSAPAASPEPRPAGPPVPGLPTASPAGPTTSPTPQPPRRKSCHAADSPPKADPQLSPGRVAVRRRSTPSRLGADGASDVAVVAMAQVRLPLSSSAAAAEAAVRHHSHSVALSQAGLRGSASPHRPPRSPAGPTVSPTSQPLRRKSCHAVDSPQKESPSCAAVRRRSTPSRLEADRPYDRLGDVVPNEVDASDTSDPAEAFVLDTPLETVTKHYLDWETKTWKTEEIQVQIDREPFGEGVTREAYRMLDHSRPVGRRAAVVKQRKRGATRQHWADVWLQEVCRALARAYNSFDPPKRIQYLPLYLIQYRGLDLTVEPYIKGRFLKHNNNRGFVPPYPRATPQAFSHFTYHYTRGAMMVVDVQGVGDIFTDPQLHTSNGRGFGMGNLGPSGMEKFLDSHHCSKVCSYLQLPAVVQGRTYSLPTTPAPKHTCPPGIPFSLSDYLPPVLDTAGPPTTETLALLGSPAPLFQRGVAWWKAFNPTGLPTMAATSLPGLIQRWPDARQREWLERHRASLAGDPVHVADVLWLLGAMDQAQGG